jgi:phosphonoacetate hydrolase
MLSHPLNATYRAIAQDRRLRNFDIFDFVLNGTAHPADSAGRD